jgi:hypothetical protein
MARKTVAKCTSLCLGGTAVARGIRNGVSVQACDNLRCTKCDLKVLTFPNQAWHADVSYLFLRNNYPAEVHSKLRSQPGGYAYCCQCAWRTVADSSDVIQVDSFASDLRWVCGGHG